MHVIDFALANERHIDIYLRGGYVCTQAESTLSAPHVPNMNVSDSVCVSSSQLRAHSCRRAVYFATSGGVLRQRARRERRAEVAVISAVNAENVCVCVRGEFRFSSERSVISVRQEGNGRQTLQLARHHLSF